MSKFYEVEITIGVTVFVEGAESKEQALEWAEDDVTVWDGSIIEARATELKTELEVDSSRRHADKVSGP